MTRSVRAFAAIAFSTLLVAGCTSSDGPPEGDAPTSDEVVTDLEPDNPDFTPGEDESPEPIPGQDGAATALSTAAEELGGQAFAIERSDDDGEEVWEVSVAVGDEDVEVHVSADGNAILHEGEREPLEDEDRRRLDEASISASEAATTATRDLGGTVEDVELNEDRGTVVWDIELMTTDGASTEVRVDAVTGEVL